MAELKTKLNDMNVDAFLDTIEDAQKREDCKALAKMMQSATRSKPAMWGTSIVGFGQRNYRYANGKEAGWFIVGFSPRKQNIALYMLSLDRIADQAKKLGKYTTAKSCLYIKRLSDVDTAVLKSLITETVRAVKAG